MKNERIYIQEFQNNLAKLLDLGISLYGEDNELVVEPVIADQCRNCLLRESEECFEFRKTLINTACNNDNLDKGYCPKENRIFSIPFRVEEITVKGLIFGLNEESHEMKKEIEILNHLKNIKNNFENIYRLETELLKKEQAFQSYKIQTDSLTKLPNRECLEETISIVQKQSFVSQNKYIILNIGIDNFKRVNDILGYSKGDRLLAKIATELSRIKGGGEFLSRLIGDEFIFLIPSGRGDRLNELKEDLNKLFGKVWRISNYEFILSFSGGIASVGWFDTAEEIIKKANTALNRCKSEKNLNFFHYDENIQKKMIETAKIERDLLNAIRRGEFVVYYQPKINLKNKSIVGLEALVRWNHPKKGLVFPNKFIKISEDAGYIGKIGEFVLREACSQNKIWQDRGYRPFKVSVNLSAIQLLEDNIVDKVIKILHETNLDPSYLELEVTETVIIEDFENVNRKLNKFREYGISISLDDFGKGYSSLNYLKKLHIDTLKIDKDFINDIDSDESEKVIVSSLIKMAKAMRFDVIAEGVEHEEQVEFLRNENCEYVQGFLFSKPKSATEIEEMLKLNN